MNYIIMCDCGHKISLASSTVYVECPSCHKTYALNEALDDSKVEIFVDPGN